MGNQILKGRLDHHLAILTSALLNDVLRNIVPEAINNKQSGTRLQLLHDDLPILICAILHEALNDAASVLLSRDLEDRATEGVHDKVKVRAWNNLDDLLDYMVAADILSNGRNVGLKLLNESGLLVNQNVLEGLEKN